MNVNALHVAIKDLETGKYLIETIDACEIFKPGVRQQYNGII
jgi:hypothetical protein